jgi:hypothetical protein
MLAALIATRQPAPPAPPLLFYSNQLAASTITFSCIAIARQAAWLTTDPITQMKLNISVPGQESFVGQLTRMHFRLISVNADNNPVYLNNTIAQVISILTALTPILQTLPVKQTVQPVVILTPTPQSLLTPGERATRVAALQAQLATALNAMKSLGQVVTQNFLSSITQRYASDILYGITDSGLRI